MKFILASASPRRKEILTRENYKFDIIISNTKEDIDNDLLPEENALVVSYNKANSVFKEHKDALVLGADTIVVYDNQIYGKPIDYDDAFRMIKLLSGKTHKVITGVCILIKDIKYNFTVTSYVTFKDLTDQEIMDYVQSNDGSGKAGGYAIQGRGKELVKCYDGELDNIIGLPIKEIKPILDKYLGE